MWANYNFEMGESKKTGGRGGRLKNDDKQNWSIAETSTIQILYSKRQLLWKNNLRQNIEIVTMGAEIMSNAQNE